MTVHQSRLNPCFKIAGRRLLVTNSGDRRRQHCWHLEVQLKKHMSKEFKRHRRRSRDNHLGAGGHNPVLAPKLEQGTVSFRLSRLEAFLESWQQNSCVSKTTYLLRIYLQWGLLFRQCL